MSKNSLDRMYAKYGFTVQFRRGVDSYNVVAMAGAFSPESGVDEAVQEEESYKTLVKNLESVDFPYPPKKGDKICDQGRIRNIFSVQPLRVHGEVVEYALRTKG
jgi:hypothetical protein